MKILVADPISPTGVELLKKQEGFEVVEAYGSTPEKIKELIKDASAVIVRSETKITADVIAASECLKAVGRAGVGVDNIDIPAATESGFLQRPRLCRILSHHDKDSECFSLQFEAEDTAKLHEWYVKKEAALHEELQKVFKDKVAGFSTIMEVIEGD